MTTNYTNGFILVSPDSTAKSGQEPAKAGSVGAIQYAMLRDAPYKLTSDDLLFLTHAKRADIAEADWPAARQEFFSKPKACLRASPLVKQFGWGLHHDENSRVALYGVETEEYRGFAGRKDLKVVNGMRSSRT
ncbi:DUF6157 family protein [Mesorhizobium sp. SB112]|uniref:DUF6157 family protein n=1 Tax=Mesorhizobium sp. SB112 TaxID=3151853 RepID=UPI0032630E63